MHYTSLIFFNSKCITIFRPPGIMVRLFANCRGDWCSIQGQVIRRTQKVVLDDSLLNTQHYKVWIKGK